MTRRICCVCQTILGYVEDGLPGVRDSHGYCPPCAAAAMRGIDLDTRAQPCYNEPESEEREHGKKKSMD